MTSLASAREVILIKLFDYIRPVNSTIRVYIIHMYYVMVQPDSWVLAARLRFRIVRASSVT